MPILYKAQTKVSDMGLSPVQLHACCKASKFGILFVGLYLWWPGGLDAPHPRTQHVCVYKDPSANMHLVQQVPLR